MMADNYSKDEVIKSLERIAKYLYKRNQEKSIERPSEKSLSNDPIYKILNSDKELMQQAMLFYQQSKVLDVLTKAREQLENVNYAINNGLHSEETKELQTNLQNDVNHLETRANKLNNKLENSNVLGNINSKVEKTKEKTNEQNNETKKSPRNRSRPEERSL